MEKAFSSSFFFFSFLPDRSKKRTQLTFRKAFESTRKRVADQRIPCVGKKGRSVRKGARPSSISERDKSTPTSRPSRSLLRADPVAPRPRASKRRAAKKTRSTRTTTQPTISPIPLSPPLPPPIRRNTRTKLRRIARAHVLLPFYEDTKRSGARRRFYANLCGSKSARARRDDDNPHRILGYRIHECPRRPVNPLLHASLLKVELDVHVYAHIVEIQMGRKNRSVVFFTIRIRAIYSRFTMRFLAGDIRNKTRIRRIRETSDGLSQRVNSFLDRFIRLENLECCLAGTRRRSRAKEERRLRACDT